MVAPIHVGQESTTWYQIIAWEHRCDNGEAARVAVLQLERIKMTRDKNSPTHDATISTRFPYRPYSVLLSADTSFCSLRRLPTVARGHNLYGEINFASVRARMTMNPMTIGSIAIVHRNFRRNPVSGKCFDHSRNLDSLASIIRDWTRDRFDAQDSILQLR